MKHLKKLSVVLMMTTLFSVSFTSCIDNEVSPLVEAIYEAQADLIAAQASVQNAEAALLLAEANAVQAQAAAQAQANASLTTGQLAVLMANAAFTNAQAALIMAQADALADMTAAQVLGLIAEAGLTDAQAALIIAQSNAIEDMTAAQVLGLIANASLTDAQAAMVLAQADAVTAMTDAQVAQMLANAGYTDAQTAMIMAEIARYEAITAHNALMAEQQLLEQIAETNLAVAEAQNDLALAQITFQTQMAAAMAAMKAAGAQIAVGYAWDYAMAMQHANNLMQQLLGAQADLANAELMQTGGVSWEFYLAQLQGEVATSMAAKASIEDAIADLQAYIANPTTPEAMVTALEAENDALEALMDAKEIELQEQYNKIMAIYEQNSVRDEIDDRIFDSLDEHNYAVDQKNDRLDWIEAAEEDIEGWQEALDDYPTALAALEDAVDAAQDAVDAAQDIYDDAVITQDAANDAQIAADAALTFLEGELDQLYESLQDAADDLATEQAAFNAGIGAATTANTNAINAITTAGANLATAQANYTLWKNRFEGNVGVDNVVNGGWFWEDTTSPSIVLGDNVLGNHTNANGVASTTYVRVQSWTYNDIAPVGAGPEDTYTPLTIGAAQQATLGANQFAILGNGTINPTQYAVTYPLLLYTTEYFVEVGLDDVVYNNLTELNNAIAALGDEDIFDVPPTLSATPLVGTDAYTTLWNAQLAQLGTQDFLDNFGDDLADAQDVYDYWKNIYERELELLDAAQQVLDDANTALGTANSELATASSNLGDANSDLSDAEDDLADLLLCDDVCLQDNIDQALLDIADWNAEILLIQPIIDAKRNVVVGLLGELTAAGVEYTFSLNADEIGTLVITNYGLLSSLYPDLHAAIIAEWQLYWSIEQELEALDNAYDLNMDLIYAYENAYDLKDFADMLEGLQEDLAEAIYDIEVAEQALAAAQVEEAADEAYISYLEAVIDTLEQRHANTLAIAAKYKALMDAALLAS